MKTIYHELLMDHFQYPRNKGAIESPDFETAVHNPSCGDRVQLFGKVEGGRLKEVTFDGSGCVISMATASLLTEKVKDKPLGEIRRLNKEDVVRMIGMDLGPTRLKCALLALQALQEGINTLGV